MVLEKRISEVVDELVDEIQKSESFLKYEEYRNKVKYDLDLKQKINRTRVIREQLSKMSENERNSDYAERLEEEYDDLCDITAVHEFSLRELEMCTMYQEVMSKLASNFNLDL